jgi:pimeloyl-ACP methyl ester carboxylesterase
MRRSLPAADIAALSEPGRLEAAQLSVHECLRNGTHGAAWDIRLYVRTFDFSLSSIRIPIHLFHGAEDRNVPIALVRSTIPSLPTATLSEFPDDAHLSLLCNHFDEIALVPKGETSKPEPKAILQN